MTDRYILGGAALCEAPIDAVKTDAAAPPPTIVTGWQHGGDDFNPRPPRRFEAGPALALTPATLPPKVSGIGWFEPPDPKQPRPLERPQPGPAITIEPPSLLTQLIGVPWAHRIDEKPLSRPIRDNSAAAIALAPATLPPQIGGMAWFEPPDIFQLRRWYDNPPGAFGQPVAAPPAPPIVVAWHRVDERPISRPVRDNSAPAIALTPATLPPVVLGMSWFEPPDTFQPRRWFANMPPAFGRAIASSPLPRGWFVVPQVSYPVRRWQPSEPPAYGRQVLTARAQVIFIGL